MLKAATIFEMKEGEKECLLAQDWSRSLNQETLSEVEAISTLNLQK
jgi:hypothetical protein